MNYYDPKKAEYRGASDGQNRLETAFASFAGGTAGGVSLDDEHFAVCRILVRAVCQFARQSSSAHRRLALHAFAGFTGGYTCRGSQDYLINNEFGFLRMFL